MIKKILLLVLFAFSLTLAQTGKSVLTQQQKDSINAMIETYVDTSSNGVNYKTFEYYGAVGDGVANDSAAVVNALSSGNSIKGISGKTYLVNSRSRINITGVNIDLSSTGEQPFTIKFGNWVEGWNNNGIRFVGTTQVSASRILKDSVIVGTDELVLTTVANIDTGDIIELRSTGTDYWTVIDDDIRKDELHLITGISGDTLTISETTWDSYNPSTNANSSDVRVFRPITVKISNMNLVYEGTSNTDNLIGIEVYYSKYDLLKNVTVENGRYSGIHLWHSYKSKIINPTITNANLSGYGYGVYLGGTFDCEVSGGTFIDCKAGVDGGTWISRGNKILNNSFTIKAGIVGSPAINVHQQSENWLFEGNIIHRADGGGIACAGLGHVIRNNVFNDVSGYVILIRGENITVEDNIIHSPQLETSGVSSFPDCIVTINMYPASLETSDGITIRNNYARYVKYGVLGVNGDGNLTNLTITGNTIFHVSTGYIITSSDADTVYYADIRDNIFKNLGSYSPMNLSSNITFIDSYIEYRKQILETTYLTDNLNIDGSLITNNIDIDSLTNVVSNFNINEDTTGTDIILNGDCEGVYTDGLAPDLVIGGTGMVATEQTGYAGDGQGFTSSGAVVNSNIKWVNNSELEAGVLYKLSFYAKRLSGGASEQINFYIDHYGYGTAYTPTTDFQKFEFTFTPTVSVGAGLTTIRFGNRSYPDTQAVFVLDNIDIRPLSYGISSTNFIIDSTLFMNDIDSLPSATDRVKIGNVGGELKARDSGNNEFILTNFPPVTIPGDSTTCTTGQIYFDATGILRRKY